MLFKKYVIAFLSKYPAWKVQDPKIANTEEHSCVNDS